MLVFFNMIPQYTDAFTTIDEQPFPLPHYRAIDSLVSVASPAQTNDVSRGVIVQDDNAHPHTERLRREPFIAVVWLRTSGPATLLFGPLEQDS
jgi:hypothetical protein